MKISYYAWRRGMSVPGLIMNSIKESYKQLVQQPNTGMNIDILLSGEVTYFESLQEYICPENQNR